MYIAKRKINELLTVGDVIVQILGINDNTVTLGIAAPRGSRITKHGFVSEVYPTLTIEQLDNQEEPEE